MTDLFQRVADVSEEKEVSIKLSYLEIYNEQIRDLLSSAPTPPGQGLPLRDSMGPKNQGQQNISVVGLTEHAPQSPQEVLTMITEGNKRRTMSPTEANAVSSRSHAILQINVLQRPRGTGLVDECTSASLNIIDLAGSERASATRNRGQRMMEGANINRSLLALANCINALCRNPTAGGTGTGGQSTVHVPYRDSKLTRLLKFSLGGNCRTVMIVCVSPSSAHFEETQKTLKYANSAKNIRTKVSQNMINVDRHVESYAKAILELQEQNQHLKKLLEQGKSLGSDADQRKREELNSLVAQSKQAMQTAFHAYLSAIRDNAESEAKLEAAKIQATELRSRLNAAHERLRSTPSDSGAIQSQVAVLQGALTIHENDPSHRECVDKVKTLEGALRCMNNTLSTLLRHPKLDEEARETLTLYSAKLQAEGEATRSKTRNGALLTALKDTLSNAAGLMLHTTRTTVSLHQTASYVEQQAARSGDELDLRGLLAPLRGQAQANDKALIELTGQATRYTTDNLPPPVAAVGCGPHPNTSHHRPRGRHSISGKRAVSVDLRGRMRRVSLLTGGPVRVAPASSGSKRPSSQREASYAAPTQASRTRRAASAMIETPRRAGRRNSLLRVPRPSGGGQSPARRAGMLHADEWTSEKAVPKEPVSPSGRARAQPLRAQVETPRRARSPGRALDLSPTKSVVTQRLAAPHPTLHAEVAQPTRSPQPGQPGQPSNTHLFPITATGGARVSRSRSPQRFSRSPTPPEVRGRTNLGDVIASPQVRTSSVRCPSPVRAVSDEGENLPPLSATRRTPGSKVKATIVPEHGRGSLGAKVSSGMTHSPLSAGAPSGAGHQVTGQEGATASGRSPTKVARKVPSSARMSNASTVTN